ncbi:MAG: transposase [Deltaproteobacteria bacterium]|jgi:SRSO17 transposase|nr:transposase [Deltaproteobacteria bacterium]
MDNGPTPWVKSSYGLGSKGEYNWGVKTCQCLGIWDDRPRNWIWLYARKFENGQIRYSIGDASEGTPVETFRELARKRWTIEQSFEEFKSDLGMTHFEGRSYVGWQRHVLLVMLFHLFLKHMRKNFSVNFDIHAIKRLTIYLSKKQSRL